MYAITDRLSQQLAKSRYRIRTGEQLNATSVRFVASRTKFIPWMLGILSVHIVVLEKDEAKPRDIDSLSDTGFKLAKRINWVPLLRGMQFGYAILPIIIGKNPDSELLLYAVSAPKLRFSLFSLPVVVDLSKCRVAFFEGYRSGGGMLWPMLQKIVTRDVEPIVDEGCSKEN